MRNLKTLKKFLFISLIAVLCGCFFAGCGMPYGAELESHANKYISEEFLNENRVYGAFYEDAGDYDRLSPEDRTFIITDENQFKEIFTNYDGEVDFDKQIVILYMFSDCSPRPYFINEIYKEKDILIVKYILEKNEFILDTTMPGTRCFMLKLEKIDFNEVEFVEVK